MYKSRLTESENLACVSQRNLRIKAWVILGKLKEMTIILSFEGNFTALENKSILRRRAIQ